MLHHSLFAAIGGGLLHTKQEFRKLTALTWYREVYGIYRVFREQVTTPQYQPPSPSILRHPIDTTSNNGELYEIIDVT